MSGHVIGIGACQERHKRGDILSGTVSETSPTSVKVTLENGESAEATAGSKRVAEQAAAKLLLERMEAGNG